MVGGHRTAVLGRSAGAYFGVWPMPVNMERVLEQWREKLLDLTKRNRLISCRLGKGGALPLENPDLDDVISLLIASDESLTFAKRKWLLGNSARSEDENGLGLLTESRASADDSGPGSSESELRACLNSPRLRTDTALTRLSDKELNARLYRLYLNARTALQEQGVNTLYLALGFLKWFESDDDQDGLTSPLLLAPVRLHRESVDAPWELSLIDEDVVRNFALAQLLKTDFRITLPALDDSPDAAACLEYLDAVEAECARHARWELLRRSALGLFSFQKMAMWEDLGKNRQTIGSHGMCRALGGDTDSDAIEPIELQDSSEFDESIHPKDTYHILDCDSSQFEAIVAAKQGSNLIVDGPPGTGKSQTIANVIAESLAEGKTVLFVSEKVAALEVVKRRLDNCNLGDFCLELHSHKANKKAVIDELGRSLYLPRQSSNTPNKALTELFDIRRQLNQYSHSLHLPRDPMKISLYQAVGRYGRLRAAPALQTDVPNVLAYDEERLATALDLVRELARLGHVTRDFQTHPWRGCTIEDTSLTLERSIAEKLPQLAERFLRRLEAFTRLTEFGFGAGPANLASLDAPVDLARAALKSPQLPTSWFEGDIRQLADRVSEIATGAGKFRAAATKLCMLKLETALASDLDAIMRRVGSSPDAEARLRQHENTRIRGLLAHVGSACRAVAGVTECVNRLTSAERELRDSIGVSHCDAIADAVRIARLARCVGDVGPSQSTWFSLDARSVLRAAATEAQNDLARVSEIESELRARINDSAFGAGRDALLRESVWYDRWWKRLLPGWRRRRLKLLEHYRDPKAISGGTLLADATLLIERANCLGRVSGLAAKHREDVLTFEDGAVNWRATQQALERLDQHLTDWGAPLPDALRSHLVDWEHARAELLLEDAETLDRRYEELRVAVDAVGALIRHVGGHGQRWDRLAVDALSQWVANCGRDLIGWRETLAALVALLVDDQDVPWEGIATVLADVKSLRELRASLNSAYQTVAQAVPGIAAPEDHDWSREAALAAWLRTFAKAHDGHPPAHLITLCTDEARRQAVAESVQLAEATRDAKFDEGWSLLASVFPLDKSVSRGITISTASIDELIAWFTFLEAHISDLRDWLDLRSVRRRLNPRGLGPWFELSREGSVTDADLPDAFMRRFWELWLDATFDSDPRLRTFRSVSHDEVVQRFRELDEAAIRASARRIRGKLLTDAERPDGEALSGPLFKELHVLRHEMEKKKRHLPLRQLFSKMPQVLLRLKPCVMMSPLSVSTFFDSDWIRFDVVIFDEASQVRPHDSIGAVYRGNQLVVAGDQRQLPPTSFFEHTDMATEEEEENEEISTSDLESILDVCQSVGLPRRRLRWHYRSRREPLIAFSNKHIYADELMTFPSVLDADGDPAIEFVHVATGRFKGGTSGGFNPVEARRVAEIVVHEMQRDRNISVGVVTFGIGQRDAVQDAIDSIRRDNRALDPLFSEDEEEPFFIKNLENVQGDERDLMIFSIGYAPPEQGTFKMNFGPLNRAGGERRLNVAVTRARSRVIVVSSIKGEAIDLSRTNALGVKLLRAYLEYAEQGPAALGAEVREDSERDFESDFEREVASALEREGFLVKHQVGCGGYRLDLALASPSRPGRYVLGVECDGATYHSHATARDRDRLRQFVLEELGWKIARIWSTSWYRDPKREIHKIHAAFKTATDADLARERASSLRAERPSQPPPKSPSQVDVARKPGDVRRDSEPPRKPTVPAASPAPPLNGNLAEVEEWVRSIEPEVWLNLATWGRRSKNLEYGEQRLLNDVAVRVRTSASLTERLTREAHQLFEKGRLLGYRPNGAA